MFLNYWDKLWFIPAVVRDKHCNEAPAMKKPSSKVF